MILERGKASWHDRLAAEGLMTDKTECVFHDMVSSQKEVERIFRTQRQLDIVSTIAFTTGPIFDRCGTKSRLLTVD